MKKKVIATTILSAAILGSLTGCGGVKTTDDSVVSTGAAEAATEAKEETKATEKAAEGETVVTFWHSLNGSAGEALETVISNYNEGQGKEKGIHVNLVFQGYEGTDKAIFSVPDR